MQTQPVTLIDKWTTKNNIPAKLSELIKVLQQVQQEFGDLELVSGANSTLAVYWRNEFYKDLWDSVEKERSAGDLSPEICNRLQQANSEWNEKEKTAIAEASQRSDKYIFAVGQTGEFASAVFEGVRTINPQADRCVFNINASIVIPETAN